MSSLVGVIDDVIVFNNNNQIDFFSIKSALLIASEDIICNSACCVSNFLIISKNSIINVYSIKLSSNSLSLDLFFQLPVISVIKVFPGINNSFLFETSLGNLFVGKILDDSVCIEATVNPPIQSELIGLDCSHNELYLFQFYSQTLFMITFDLNIISNRPTFLSIIDTDFEPKFDCQSTISTLSLIDSTDDVDSLLTLKTFTFHNSIRDVNSIKYQIPTNFCLFDFSLGTYNLEQFTFFVGVAQTTNEAVLLGFKSDCHAIRTDYHHVLIPIIGFLSVSGAMIGVIGHNDNSHQLALFQSQSKMILYLF
ncbi:hypothetical protein GEMRC1_011638 [Eukaryota sp. GEM-RC1]